MTDQKLQPSQTSAALLNSSLQNHASDAGTLFDMYATAVYGLILKALPDAADAECVMRELFCCLPEHRVSCHHPCDSQLNWLLNTARKLSTKKLYNLLSNSQFDLQLEGLPINEKTIYKLYYQMACSTQLIADRLSLSVAAVEYCLQKASSKMGKPSTQQ